MRDSRNENRDLAACEQIKERIIGYSKRRNIFADSSLPIPIGAREGRMFRLEKNSVITQVAQQADPIRVAMFWISRIFQHNSGHFTQKLYQCSSRFVAILCKIVRTDSPYFMPQGMKQAHDAVVIKVVFALREDDCDFHSLFNN